MTMPFYTSVEQLMRDRSELARKGISRGRSVAVLTYDLGVLLLAENTSTTLHKVSEIYDRIGFAAVGRYSEFESLRTAGIRLADMRGYSYDRRDVTGRQLANSYAHALSAIFTEQQKPYEVELCVAEVGATPEQDQLYRLIYDGSIFDEPGCVVMGGQAEAMTTGLRERHDPGMDLAAALALGIGSLAAVGGVNGAPRAVTADMLEVAILDRTRLQRTFRRLAGATLAALLPPVEPGTPGTPVDPAEPAGPGDPATPGAVQAQPPGPESTVRNPAAAPATHPPDPAAT